MEDLKVFKSTEFGELGVLMIDGKEYFPAVQCAKVLGYSNPRDAVKRHCKIDGVVKHDGVSYTTNQHGITTQQVTEIKYINEGNLYRLIVSSRLPSAEKFESGGCSMRFFPQYAGPEATARLIFRSLSQRQQRRW